MSIDKYNATIQRYILNANSANVALDCHSHPDKCTVAKYMQHLQDCYDCPTLGFLAREEYMRSDSINYPRKYARNKCIIEHVPTIIDMKSKIRGKINKDLYPRTKRIRKYIIKSGRLSLF